MDVGKFLMEELEKDALKALEDILGICNEVQIHNTEKPHIAINRIVQICLTTLPG